MDGKQNRRKFALAIGGFAVFLIAVLFPVLREENESEQAVFRESFSERAETEPEILVYVTGAVVREGVFSLKKGARILDAVNASGGFSEDADTGSVNLAETVYDGMHVRIPAVGESLSQAIYDDRIDLNTADEKTLQSLSGIGEAKASAIVAYRKKHGPFASVEDVMNVSGIGEALFDLIKEKVKV